MSRRRRHAKSMDEAGTAADRRCRRPRSLFGRLMVIWLVGLLVVLGVSQFLYSGERERSGRNQLFEQVATDVVTVVWLLDATPPADRPALLERLQAQRTRYRLQLAPLPDGTTLDPDFDHPAWSRLAAQLGARPLNLRAVRHGIDGRPTLYLGTALADGSPFLVAAALPRPGAPPSRTLAAFAILVIGLALLTWIAVRIATRPLSRLAEAATALGEDLERAPLAEQGPLEVRRAAAAFNRMQGRIRELFAERTRILAAITHDLRTPITRLRLRAELLDGAAQRERILADLAEMETLVDEGLAYAKSMSPASEPALPVQLDALLAALVADYADGGRAVTLAAAPPLTLDSRPQTLRRLLANLIDNALKFAGEAELTLEAMAEGATIRVRDHGPGIPEAELEKALEPYYRVESSRNRDSGGTGLGLAIARQLARSLGGELSLHNRDSGGLEARLRLSRPTP